MLQRNTLTPVQFIKAPISDRQCIHSSIENFVQFWALVMEKLDFGRSQKILDTPYSMFISFLGIVSLRKLIKYFSRVCNVQIELILKIYLE